MDNETKVSRQEILALTTEIVSAYAGNHKISAVAVPDLIAGVFTKLSELSADAQSSAEDLVPAVPIKKSVTPDYIVCLEEGKKLKMLKRHLMTSFGMTPEEYRLKWGLSADYPMVAPNYAAVRHELAKKIGLGRKPKNAADAAPKPEPVTRSRRSKAAA